MVARRRRDRLVDHPARLVRFDPTEWPGTPREALAEWRREFDAYWQGRMHPHGLHIHLATMRVAAILAETGEVVAPETYALKYASYRQQLR